MDKKKSTIIAWVTAGVAILGLILLIIATFYAIFNMEALADEASNWQGAKPHFTAAISIAGTAVGLQIAAIVMSVVHHVLGKNKEQQSIEGSY